MVVNIALYPLSDKRTYMSPLWASVAGDPATVLLLIYIFQILICRSYLNKTEDISGNLLCNRYVNKKVI